MFHQLGLLFVFALFLFSSTSSWGEFYVNSTSQENAEVKSTAESNLEADATNIEPVTESAVVEEGQAQEKTGASAAKKDVKKKEVKDAEHRKDASQKETIIFSPSDENAAHKLNNSYRIGVDDVLQISVWRNPDLSVTVPVRPDGKISAPLIGDVIVGGRTPQDVANQIKQHLEKYIRDPHVSVILQELRSHEFLSRVRVTGAVKAPISVPFRQGMSVLDLVLVAGGVSEFASENKTKLYRKQDGKTISMDVYLKDILKKGDLETNFTLQPGDIITVPEKLF